MAINDREILQELRAERNEMEAAMRELDAAIAVFERRVARARTPVKPQVVQTAGGPTIIGSYSDMSTPEAAKSFLRTSGTPQTPKDIEKALKAGNIQSESKNFYSTLYTTLRRLEAGGEVVKLDDGTWTLPELATQEGLQLD